MTEMKQEIVKSEIEISGVVRKSTTYRKNIFKKYRECEIEELREK